MAGISLSQDTRNARQFVLSFDSDWARSFPQSAYLLNEECVAWQKTPWSLRVVED